MTKNSLRDFILCSTELWGFPGGASGKEPTCQCRRRKILIPGSGRSPGRAFLPGESHGQRSLVGYTPWGHKESDTTRQLMLSNTCWSLMAEYTKKQCVKYLIYNLLTDLL